MHTPRFVKTFWAALASVALFGGIASTSIASTPDGETPANEAICDVLQGMTPGLYGLCVAYCEAQDLDVVGDKPMPNSRILANYRKKMNAGDPDMPCLKTVSCPCWDATDLAVATAHGNPVCTIDAPIAQLRNASTTGVTLARVDTTRPECRYADTASMTQRQAQDFPTEEAQACFDMVVSACAAIGQ